MGRLMIIIGIVLIVLSLSLPVKAGSTGTKCTLLKGAKVVQSLPNGKVRLGIHPEDTQVEVVERVSMPNANQISNITKMNWSNSFVVSFVIHPNPKDQGFAETIYLFVRSTDLKQCIK